MGPADITTLNFTSQPQENDKHVKWFMQHSNAELPSYFSSKKNKNLKLTYKDTEIYTGNIYYSAHKFTHVLQNIQNE